ncbi:hypothetical protein, partial [Microbacterium sp. LB12]|uniref:hypothetical protein n=2 Tax=unclassified Microbacterium TaxID=2609290 RepID=UPI0030163FAC
IDVDKPEPRLAEHARPPAETTQRKAKRGSTESRRWIRAERPILRLAVDVYEDKFRSRHLLPIDKKAYSTADELVASLEGRITDGGGLIGDVVYEDLGTLMPMAVLDSATGRLSINLEHPFVAHFADEYNDRKNNLPLELFAIAEILLEAGLNDANVGDAAVTSILDSRDELLRHLARSSGAQPRSTMSGAVRGRAVK